MALVERIIHRTLANPFLVAGTCVTLALGGLAVEGSLFRYGSLKSEQQRLTQEIEKTRAQTRVILTQISEAHSPQFIERQARDRLDLVEKDDLVFLFSDDVGALETE